MFYVCGDVLWGLCVFGYFVRFSFFLSPSRGGVFWWGLAVFKVFGVGGVFIFVCGFCFWSGGLVLGLVGGLLGLLRGLLCGGCGVAGRVGFLEGEVERLGGLVEFWRGRFDECSASRSLLVAECDGLRRDLEFAEGRLARLSARFGELAAERVGVPVLDVGGGGVVFYSPWDDGDLPRVFSMFLDNGYCVLGGGVWDGFLGEVAGCVGRASGGYVSEAWDCDDFAWLAFSVVRLAGRRAGLRWSPAFGWARSRGHAYNVYRDDGGVWWVWEPQTGERVCRLDSPSEERYETIKAII